MQAAKASSSQPVIAAEASKRTERQTKPETKPEASNAKKAEEQNPPRATTNAQGETLGRLLNARA
jgi:hypothetical protein